ncbi:MAG: glycerophosphodiester phosphodiesterase [Anaerolineae bacterium]
MRLIFDMGFDLRRRPGAPPKVVGHRGACDLAPENTLASFERAWRDGADIIEMDVRLSADGHVVVFHDATVDRTTDGAGEVATMSLAQLKRLDAGAWFSPEFAGERIPTLREAAAWAKGRIGMLIELKFSPYGSFDPELAPLVLDILQDLEVLDQVATISYQPRALVQLKVLAPGVPAGPMRAPDHLLRIAAWLVGHWSSLARVGVIRRRLLQPLTFTQAWGGDIVAPNIEVVTRPLVEAAHASGCAVSCGGLAWDYPVAIALGIDTISSNNPGLIRALYLPADRTTTALTE